MCHMNKGCHSFLIRTVVLPTVPRRPQSNWAKRDGVTKVSSEEFRVFPFLTARFGLSIIQPSLVSPSRAILMSENPLT